MASAKPNVIFVLGGPGAGMLLLLLLLSIDSSFS
jgi:hypothetical protein